MLFKFVYSKNLLPHVKFDLDKRNMHEMTKKRSKFSQEHKYVATNVFGSFQNLILGK